MFKEKEIKKVSDMMGVESSKSSAIDSKAKSMDKVQDKMGYPEYKKTPEKGSPSFDRVVENIL